MEYSKMKKINGVRAVVGVILCVAVLCPLTNASAPQAAAASSQSPGWSAWKHRLPVRLAGLTAPVSKLLPVDVMFTLKADECVDPLREIRLLYRSPDGRESEVPFQLSRLLFWDRGDAEFRRPHVRRTGDVF